MSKLLYIKASPRKERSKSIATTEVFIKKYRRQNPTDEIDTLDLFEENLPAFDGLTVQAKYTILHGKEHTTAERQAWDAVEGIIERFKSADKYVIAAPMWNFGIPYRLKHYIDILVQPGYTFTADENGYEGLVKGKPVLCVYARGGAYSADPQAEAMDLQKRYLEQILSFIGFEKVHSIVVEPTLACGPKQTEQVLESSVERAVQLADRF